MNPLAFDVEETLKRMSEETGIEYTLIKQKMEEKIAKFGGLLTEQGALVLMSKEMNVRTPLLEKSGTKMTLGELKPGMNNIDVHARVTRADPVKTYSKNGKEGKYASIRLQDTTGEALFTFWNEQAEEAHSKGLKVGSTLNLSNARVGVFNGQTQLSLGYNGTYSIEAGNADMENEPKAEKIPFSSLKENEPFEGNVHVVDVFPGKGYYVRCTACAAKLQYRDTICPQCGKEGSVETRLLVSLLLDDGTAALRGVAFENEAVSLMGKTKEEILTAMDDEKLKMALWQEIRGKTITIQGRGKKGMDATSVEIILQRIQPRLFQNA
jgi:hypothetical protein